MLAALGLAAWLVAGLAPWVGAQSSVDWPGFQGGPQHLGEGSGPRAPLRASWTIKATGANPRLSAAVVAGGLAVAVSRNEVRGFDPGSGATVWTTTRAAGALTPPALDPTAGTDGVVVVTEGTTESNSAVVGLDLTTHQRLWAIHLRKPVLGAPTIAGGAVYVGGTDGFVYAIDGVTGNVRWKTHTLGAVDTSPAVAGDTVLASADDLTGGRSRLYAFDAATGRRRWTYAAATPATGGSAVTVDGQRVYAGFADHTVRALDLRTGRLLWDEAVRDAFSPFTSPAVSGGVVYAADQSGGLYAFDAATGARRWDFAFQASVLVGAPLVLGGQVFLGLSDGTLAAVDTASGDLVWETVFAAGAIGPLAPTGSVLLVPVVGPRGGLVGLASDPSGQLIRRESPSRLHVPLSLANYAGAFVIAALVIVGGFRLLSSRVGQPSVEPLEGSESWERDDDLDDGAEDPT